MKVRSALILPSLTLCLFAFSGACGGDGDDADGTGGKGGKGGSGGSATGGKGGSGGSSVTGGTGGGSTGGMGGSTGGTGGSTGGAGGGGVKPVGADAFFSGKDDKITKLVTGDANPGYFYVAPPSGGGTMVNTGKIVTVPADPALPPGTTHAYEVTVIPDYAENVIVGWNWRENESDMKFKFFDASAFAGISFYAKASKPFFQNVNIHDAPSLSMTGFGGSCPATQDTCRLGTSTQARYTMADKWVRYVQRFEDIVGATSPAFDLKTLGRVDLLNPRTGVGPDLKFWITGIELLKAGDLPPREDL